MSQEEMPLDSMLDQPGALTEEEVAYWQAAGRMARLAGASILVLVSTMIGILAYLTIFERHDFIGGLRYYRLLDFVDRGLLLISVILLVIAGIRCFGFGYTTKELSAEDEPDQILLPSDQLRLIFTLLAVIVMLMLAKWMISIIFN
ncbi:MAG: hypothetical protein AAF741_03600 [Bacteroidota bacterium]